MFNLEWMLKDFDRHDLSSLKFAAYGGNAVARPFLEKLADHGAGHRHRPGADRGLRLVYLCAGKCGRAGTLPIRRRFCPVWAWTCRFIPAPFASRCARTASAGDELPAGEIGHVCFRGPQTFLGYVNDPEATAKTISRDGYLYTGDLGYWDAAGLHLTGREKWVIKSMGYQIFPGDVEAHICALTEKVANCVAVGVAHAVLSEAVVAVVEKRPGVELSRPELERQRAWAGLVYAPAPLDHSRSRADAAESRRQAGLQARAGDGAAGDCCLRERGEWDTGLGAVGEDQRAAEDELRRLDSQFPKAELHPRG